MASLVASTLAYPQGGAQSFSSFSTGPIATQGGLGLGSLGQGSLGLAQGSFGLGQGSLGLIQSPVLVHKPVLLHKEVEVEHYVSIGFLDNKIFNSVHLL